MSTVGEKRLKWVESLIFSERLRPFRTKLAKGYIVFLYVWGALLAIALLMAFVGGPFTWYLLPAAGLLATSIVLIAPFIKRVLPKRLLNKGPLISGTAMFLVSVIALSIGLNLLQVHEEARKALMTPEQLADQIAYEEELKRKQEEKWEAEWAAERNEVSKDQTQEQEKRQEAAAKIENENQRRFYAQLGRPKLLYKCDDSPFEKAIGSSYASYNLLLEEAYRVCGRFDVDIIKNDK